jgi:hypothetical protein
MAKMAAKENKLLQGMRMVRVPEKSRETRRFDPNIGLFVFFF